MFGLFDGLFGEGFMADATECALEMCLLDEMERDELRNGGGDLDDLDLEDLDDFDDQDY